jgi:hypothetical protein
MIFLKKYYNKLSIFMLRYLSRPLFKQNLTTRSAAASIQPAGDYIPSDTNTRNWLARLG